MEKNRSSRVCVTGASGFIGSSLVNKLLQQGHTVHATLRNLDDASKVGLLKSLPNADTKLLLFQADVYDPQEFEPAIVGCEFVFHVATPMQHNNLSSQYKDTAEAAVAGVRIIADSCIRSQTVKRLIYTASILAASPRTEDGAGFKPYFDESCWTPLDVSFPHGTDFTMGYIVSKTLAEKAVLSYNDIDGGKLEAVTLPCGLVGGETLLPNSPLSVGVVISQLTADLNGYNALKFMQEVIGSVPLVHIEDVCRAHIFCMEQPSMRGRFCCAVASPSIKEIAACFQENYPEYKIAKEFAEGPEEGIKCDFTKLVKIGFEYKYGMKSILDDSVASGRSKGDPVSTLVALMLHGLEKLNMMDGGISTIGGSLMYRLPLTLESCAPWRPLCSTSIPYRHMIHNGNPPRGGFCNSECKWIYYRRDQIHRNPHA